MVGILNLHIRTADHKDYKQEISQQEQLQQIHLEMDGAIQQLRLTSLTHSLLGNHSHSYQEQQDNMIHGVIRLELLEQMVKTEKTEMT